MLRLALARAEAVAADEERMQAYIDKARGAAGGVDDEESNQMLLSELDTVQV
ncbi:MAG: hypothetical protein BMS9Abin02_2097 [Anaerolineae bacterium]|nr:MAG: hypothetical protein BMS9Abin02_2097 [Anaerolineae bacterium]